ARSYITKYRSFIPEQMPHESLQQPIKGPQYCEYPLSCRKDRFPDHSKHATIVCDVITITQRDDGNYECGQYIMDEYIVMQWPIKPIIELFEKQTSNSSQLEIQKDYLAQEFHFIFTAKKETIRDLVLFPKPPLHLTNRQLVQLPFFWATAILTSKMLHHQLQQKTLSEQKIWPVEAIAINFGQWETAGFYDKRLIDCHAHAHLLLNLTFINACDNTFFSALKGRVDEPPNYLKQNARLLHFDRLHNHEFNSQQMDDFSNRLTNVENALQGVKTNLKGVKTDFQGVKTDFQGVNTDLEDVKTNLQGLKGNATNLTTYVDGLTSGMKDMESLLNKVYDLLTNNSVTQVSK
ncbi:unnamed protein product, partial [Rotaria sp. Silwood1]